MLQLRTEKEKLAAKLQEACAQADHSVKMMELANESLRSSRDRRRAHAEEIAKLREELEKERRAHADSKIQFELGLAQAKTQQTEAWKALEEERRAREESALSEKAAY